MITDKFVVSKLNRAWCNTTSYHTFAMLHIYLSRKCKKMQNMFMRT